MGGDEKVCLVNFIMNNFQAPQTDDFLGSALTLRGTMNIAVEHKWPFLELQEVTLERK